ncbi:hypothetical protein T08_6522 [Trichinella sp. T8]|nr:hypothetical protein T08_6522 [Trichinella sp. T8]
MTHGRDSAPTDTAALQRKKMISCANAATAVCKHFRLNVAVGDELDDVPGSKKRV